MVKVVTIVDLSLRTASTSIPTGLTFRVARNLCSPLIILTLLTLGRLTLIKVTLVDRAPRALRLFRFAEDLFIILRLLTRRSVAPSVTWARPRLLINIT